MTLPVIPDVETILANSAAALRDQVLPELTDVWPRSCTRLVIASLEYALELMRNDHGAVIVEELTSALDALRPELPADAAEVVGRDGSPFEMASRLLVWSQEHPGADADTVRSALHPVLTAQLDRESATALPLVIALAQAMWSTE
jgi:hypothetical protein